MDELHAAIAAHLRAQHRGFVYARHEAAVMGLWRERCATPRCKICGAAIDDDDGGLYDLADLRQVRECALHHTPF